MSARLAIGVGCRAGCPAAVIEALVRRALDRAPAVDTLGLFTIADKAEENGLLDAARRLRLGLVFLTRDALLEQTPFVQTLSDRVNRLFGVPSVAEAAALAGAGANAVLLVARIADRGATCAVAGSREIRR